MPLTALKKAFLSLERCEKKREDFLDKIKTVPPESLVFIDESVIDSYVCRLSGRAPRGQKVRGEKSGTRYARHSFVAAKCGKKILAPRTYKGTCTAKLFEKWIEKILLPELEKGQIIIMDNATFHKSERTKML
jgi:hypothetical protein